MSWQERFATVGEAIGRGVDAAMGIEAGQELVKAAQPLTNEGRPPVPVGWDFNPYDMPQLVEAVQQADNHSHPGTRGLPFDVLRQMAAVPHVSAVIGTRITQAREFCSPSQSPYEPGFEIRLRDKAKKGTKASQKRALEIQDWMLTCGDPRIKSNVPRDFEAVTVACLFDSLRFDALALEVVPTRGGKVAGFVPLDASTIRRRSMTDAERKQGRRLAKDGGWVQILGNSIKAQWDEDAPSRLIYGIRRPRNDVRAFGYGHPELEVLIRIVTHLLEAEQYNSGNFKRGVRSDKILALVSRMGRGKFAQFMRRLMGMASGASGAKTVPVVQLDPDSGEDLKSIDLGQSNREMEFSQWFSWNLRLVCAIYGMDPAEIGYQYGNEGQTQSLSDKGPGEKLAYSRERGLRPLIRFWQRTLNRGIVHHLDEDFELVFTGFNADDTDKELERDTKAIQNYMTVNEVRARRDLPPLDGGDIILSPTWLQAMGQAQAMAEGGEGGEGAPEGAPEGEEGEEGGGAPSLDPGMLFGPAEGEDAEEGEEGEDAEEGEE